MTKAVTTALASLAVLTQVVLAIIVVIALLSLVFAPARRLLVEIRDTLLGGELWAAWAFALVATLGSLYFSQVADFVPCELCWFQRIAMYPMVIVLFVSALRGNIRVGVQYSFLFPIIGILISIYHIYIEQNPSAAPKACNVGGASCVTKWIDKFGYITIPVLAGTAFAAIIVLVAMAWSRREPAATR
jgi:disulfide bond formation protein DsbB